MRFYEKFICLSLSFVFFMLSSCTQLGIKSNEQDLKKQQQQGIK